MKEFERILFPIDFSDCSKRVFPLARYMAERFGARLYLLFVARDLSYFATMDVESELLKNTVREIAIAGEKQMLAFCDKHLIGFSSYETCVVVGTPTDEILRFADEHQIDLIVMGTHGRKGLRETMMGSVADHVIKHASVPVMTFNPFRPGVKGLV